MGTHSKAPSQVVLPGGEVQDLRTLLQANPDLMGSAKSAEGQLPYLFKVLSVNKTLSIQAHPDKALAEKLRQQDPEHYLDDNHKPEMAIALTPFEGMCGFRPLAEVAAFLSSYPEFHALVGDAAAACLHAAVGKPQPEQHDALKKCFSALMHADPKMVEAKAAELQARLEAKADKQLVDNFVLRVHSQFPGDVGCFCLFMLNIVQLQPGQAIFLGPNLPHAYMAGDCIECMAASDNVVRAGCTGKFKDVDNLVNMLTYETGTAQEQGGSLAAPRGSTFFIAADAAATVEAKADTTLFRAYC
ncbi:mannose-6-phosphate isomerase [Salpingoeca rosetta]|uniref:mannose-6-phosphate isomerase n=1 Tax=Salpingoeca rosetta (strain ATCC 50818 / BSB-021) TaxID=946362 RepID=F2TZM1_SALR5|nr:mannose-6-phosphate isomerase [Salpingoeca rosetta]EGD79045.1 mannose-6-phosphate isomerase [Salpingoeca rosetta]|eukprot:XP_004998001.1 mannose-6-phosphate isomerase [Salpingoeca rosetta]